MAIPFLSESDVFDFYRDREELRFVRRGIEELVGKKIVGSRTVFRKSEHLNFHFFVDKLPNIMLVILLINGVKIGGFV